MDIRFGDGRVDHLGKETVNNTPQFSLGNTLISRNLELY